MQEEVENRTVNLAISTTRLTVRTIVAGIRMYLQHHRNAQMKKSAKMEGVHGKQSVKELIGQNQGVARMPLGDASIRDFEREARKYGVDFAVTKDKSMHPPLYTIFVKAKDNDALQHIADSLLKRQLSAEKKPSIMQTLQKLKALVSSIPNKARHREQEHVL